jgi:hypothetical protein
MNTPTTRCALGPNRYYPGGTRSWQRRDEQAPKRAWLSHILAQSHTHGTLCICKDDVGVPMPLCHIE